MSVLRFLAVLVLLLVAAPSGAFEISIAPTPIRPYDHDPNDLRMKGALSWDMLRELEIAYESPLPGQTSVTTSFTTALEEIDGKEVKLVGFLYPLEAGESHRYFLLSAFPPSCPFCLPGGVTDLVEVKAAEPVPFTYDPLVVSGRFALLRDDPSGLLYRLEGAKLVR